MPIFDYSARSSTGEKIEDSVAAVDRRSAVAEIERRGQVPVSIKEQVAAKPGRKAGRFQFTWRRGSDRLGGREVLLFTTELSDLLASGMTLGNALHSLARRQAGKPGDRVLADLRDEIVRGSSLSKALERHPATFSHLYCSMIMAGEASGAMADVLRRLVEHYERVQEVKEQVVMALVYPIIVLILGAITLVFSMVYVVPKFKVIFDQLGSTLPLPTRMLIAASGWLGRYGLVALLIGAGLCTFGNRIVKQDWGRRKRDRFLLKLPLVRGIVASGIYANFARTLATLLVNGVPVLQALSIVSQTVGNMVISDAIKKAKERVTDGTTISGPLAGEKVFPEILTDMLSIGEQTGDMAGALEHIARRYENELERNIKIFTTALEPILIVLVALMVGFVAVSILMAVFNLTNGLNV